MRARALAVLGCVLLAGGATLPGAEATPEPGTTERVSVDLNGDDADSWSSEPAVISGDGRYVVFTSFAHDLVSEGNGRSYLRDLQSGTTSLVGWEDYNLQLSADGRHLAFYSGTDLPGDTNGWGDVYVRDLVSGTVVRASLSETNGQFGTSSSGASISDDARFVAFTVVPKSIDCAYQRVYVRDLVAASSRLIDRCAYSSAISGDGNSILYQRYNATTDATDLILRRLDSSAEPIIVAQTAGEGAISGDGQVAVYRLWDTKGNPLGLYAYDVSSGTTTRIDVSTIGEPADNAQPVSGVQYYERGPAVSGDGRIIAFSSYASNLVPGDGNGAADVFVRDTVAGTTERLSVDVTGGDANGKSTHPSISSDSRLISFVSDASDLIADDGNGLHDIFVRHYDRRAGPCAVTSSAIVGTAGDDVLTGTPGADVILGLGGNDRITGLGSDDRVCGGGGIDTIEYGQAPAAVLVDLALGTASGEGNDTLFSVENIDGSPHPDRLRGSGTVNLLRGFGGADALSGFGADDTLDGGSGNDKLYGYDGNDSLFGGSGDDLLSGGKGGDTLDGGDGTDTCQQNQGNGTIVSCEP